MDRGGGSVAPPPHVLSLHLFFVLTHSHKRTHTLQVVVVPRAQNDIDTDAIVNDLQEKWEAVENKPAAIIYATGAVAGVWVANSVVGAINALPLLPKVFELVGLGYSAWFTYRYLLFKSNREELVDDIEAYVVLCVCDRDGEAK